ncbi:hypothetical protein SeMB42_g06293 [Synchytrium endobioticum]|uniref:RRM domain-containing protein n=1 Tax=Synchytrium endobioticum TaxID=286115 RepID=A0A507CJ88_9FUNG|nr:hypothetical protein SeMB42_g06293 [Synchytrium endobioticum]TPX43482.1 hypothetical protein SeLEV6574_g05043 [Synchytrium endobioticum]
MKEGEEESIHTLRSNSQSGREEDHVEDQSTDIEVDDPSIHQSKSEVSQAVPSTVVAVDPSLEPGVGGDDVVDDGEGSHPANSNDSTSSLLLSKPISSPEHPPGTSTPSLPVKNSIGVPGAAQPPPLLPPNPPTSSSIPPSSTVSSDVAAGTDPSSGANMAMLQAWYEQQQQQWAAMAQQAPPGTVPPSFYPGYPPDPAYYYYNYQAWAQQHVAPAQATGAPGESNGSVTTETGNSTTASATVQAPPSMSSSINAPSNGGHEPPWKRERMDRPNGHNHNDSTGNHKSNHQSKQLPQPAPALNQFGGPYAVHYTSTSSDIAKLPTGSRLFIGNMASEKTSREELGEIFRKYGNIKEILMKNSYAFIQFDNPEACKLAVQHEQGRLLGGLNMDLKQSRDKPLPGQNRDQITTGPPPQDDTRREHDNSRNRGPGRPSSNSHPNSSTDHHRDSHEIGGSGGPVRNNRYGSNNRDDRAPYTSTSRGGGGGGRHDSRRNDDHDRHGGNRRDDRDSYKRDSPDRRPLRFASPPGAQSHNASDYSFIQKRYGSKIPEVQILALGDVDRKYITSVETIAKSAGMTVDIVRLSRDTALRPIVQQLIEEGVLAVVFVETYHERDQAISMQILGGPNANTEYNGIRAVTMPNILMRERTARNAAMAQHANKNMNAQQGNYGAPPNQATSSYYKNQGPPPQQSYYGQPPMQQPQAPVAAASSIATALLATLPPHIIAMLPNGGVGLDQGILIALVTAHSGGNLTPQQMAIIAGAASSSSTNNNMPMGGSYPMQPTYQQPYAQQQASQHHRNMMTPPSAPPVPNMNNSWHGNPSGNSIPTLSGYSQISPAPSPHQSGYGLPPQQQANQPSLLSSLSGMSSLGGRNTLASGGNPGSAGTTNVGGMLEQLKQLQAFASFQGSHVSK